MKKLLVFIILFLGFLVVTPQALVAQTPECDELKQQLEQHGGGRALSLPQYCSEAQVYTKLSNQLYYLIGIVAVVTVIYGSYVLMTAAGDEKRRTQGKNIILYTLAGVVLVFFAAVIVNVVINLVVDNQIF